MPLITSTPFKSLSYQQEVLLDSPHRYFRLGESSGPVVDEIVGSEGTWNGTAGYGATSLISGDSNNASSFNGASYIEMGNSGTLNLGTVDFAVEFWMSSTSTTDTQAIFDKRTSGPTTGYLIGYGGAGGTVGFYMASGGSNAFGGNTTNLSDGQPHHVVINFDRNTNAEVWVDNVLEGTPSISGVQGSLNNTQNARIGYKSPITSVYTYFDGVIDEYAFYHNKTLSAARIAAHYNAGS